jgi:hypothetical protein
MRRFLYWVAILCSGIALIIALLYGLAAFVQAKNLQSEIGLPLLTISGVVALLGVLALVAIIFSSVNLTDPTQALGLPVGSVRAVIALSLIVLFAILTVYLFSNLANGSRLAEQTCLTAAERQEFLSTFPVGQFHFSTQMSDEAVKTKNCPQLPTANHASPEPRFSVTYSINRNPASEDFAKQLLVLIGTLVTSVAGFYFGAQAVSQAQQTVAGLNLAASITGVDPSVLKAGETKDINVMGSNLNAINRIQLVAGSDTLTSTSVTSNSGRVQATIAVPAGAPAGPWDIVASDPQGRTSRLPQAVRIEGQSAQQAPSSPSDLLDRYLNAGDLAPEIRQERLRNIQKAAEAEGMADTTIGSFIRETTPDAQQRQARVARRLGLLS